MHNKCMGLHRNRLFKQSMPCTGTSKDLFESYLQQWLWGQHYGDDPFAKTLSSISLTSMKYAKMRKFCSPTVPLHALFVIRSPFHGEKKQNTQLQHMGLNWRKEISRKIMPKDTMKVSNNFISLQFSFITLET